MASSSGGVFTQLAEQTIEAGGVVFGVKWNEHFEAVHAYTESKEGLAAFRGSKYVQSRVGNTFKQAEQFLKQGRQVLYSGTPCQIAALKLFLRKDYENLLAVDIVCHGVPSPQIWIEYMTSLKLDNIAQISHKDKTTGWKGYSFSIKNVEGKVIYTQKASTNKYLSAFVKNLILRPSCFSCPSKAGKSLSDITLADYWGVERLIPQMDDNKGISLLCVNTTKGRDMINQLDIILEATNFEESILYNSCIVKSTSEPRERKTFWKDYRVKGIRALPMVKREHILRRIFKRFLRR
jgi:coenzyme F420-reducing hydrogenase beta subunit